MRATSISKRRVALIIPIFLSITRPDLAKKGYERAKKWVEDDLLFQLIESSISLLTGKEACLDLYTERLANPSLSSTKVPTAQGVTRLLHGEVSEARSDPEKAISQEGADDGTVAMTETIQQGRRRQVVE